MAKIDLLNLKNVQEMSRDQIREIREIQRALINSGYLDRTFQSKFGERSSDDGFWGSRSAAALKAYQADNTPKDFSNGAGFIWNPAAGYDHSSEFSGNSNESKPTENKPVYNPYPEGASTGIPGFVEEAIVRNKEKQANRDFDLSSFDRNNPESVTSTQQWLINNGYLTEDAAHGGWGPKSQAAYDSAVLDSNVPKRFDAKLSNGARDFGFLGNIFGSINDVDTYFKWQRKVDRAKESGDVNEEGIPQVNMNWNVNKHQLSQLAGLLPEGLTASSYPTWVGDSVIGKGRIAGKEARYSNTWDNPEFQQENQNIITRGLGWLSSKIREKNPDAKIATYLDMGKTSLEYPGRGSIGGFSIRTSPKGIFISDGYEFAADPSKVSTTEAQSEGYNEVRRGMNEKYRGNNNTSQQYFISWDAYNDMHK